MALPHFVWFIGSEQASPARAAVRMPPGSTQTAGEPPNRGKPTPGRCAQVGLCPLCAQDFVPLSHVPDSCLNPPDALLVFIFITRIEASCIQQI